MRQPTDLTAGFLVHDIEEFAGPGEYLSLPIRICSAGMTGGTVAMAAVQSPEVLPIDERIGASAPQFQDEARARIKSFVDRAEFFGNVDEGFRRYAGPPGRH